MLEVTVSGLRLRNPLMNASGILGSRPEHVRRLAEAGFAAVVSKSFTREPREGYPTPIIVEAPTGGLLNSVGLANPGIHGIKPLVKEARRLGVPIIVSIAGSGEDEFSEVAGAAEEAGADAVELNLSCPHAEGYGLEIGVDPVLVSRVVSAASSVVNIPVWAKLGLSDRLVESAGTALEAGARAVVLMNTVRAMAIDVYTRRPVLGHGIGGLSGPPIHPIAVRAVYEVYREYRAEIIGVGGIENWETAAEMMLAGAKALQIGSALVLKGFNIVSDVLRGLEKYVRELGYNSIEDVVGAAHA